MLTSVHVKNIALIREEEISFGSGLNILTGETGAGKSLIIGSVNIALGTASFKDYVAEGTDYSLVELIFETESERAAQRLEQEGIPFEDGQIVISRRYQKGRSISRVNGESVTVSFVRDLASDLIDIHGQHQHQSLLYPHFHLQLLDKYASAALGDLKEVYQEQYQAWTGARRELAGAVTDEQERAKQTDMLSYEIDEIEKAALQPGEDTRLEAEFNRMSNGQRIMEALEEVSTLTGGEVGDSISRGVRALSSVSAFDEPLEKLEQELSAVEDMLGDFGRSLSSYMDDFSYDEEEYYRISQRLDLINHLKSKYGRTIEDILSYEKTQQEKLDQLRHYEDYLAGLRAREKETFSELSETARQISRIRKAQAGALEEKITQALRDLNFLDAKFQIAFEKMQQPGADGADQVCFMISTNPGMPLRPLQETASGGELSRIMLAIKSVMADEDAVETLIFDEIDTGISGRTAQKVAEKMALIAAKHQVICITHLAQIAAMADNHYEISKQVQEGQTRTRIRLLGEEESIQELARILGGVKITDNVLQSAREMRQMALAIKEERS